MQANLCWGCFQDMGDTSGVCPHCGYAPGQEREKFPLALPPGTTLGGRYILGRVLGQGGFGITYVAQDYKTKSLVAIKEFFPEAAASRTDARTVSSYSGQREESFLFGKERFLEEAQTLAEFIGNANIVRVHSYFEENNTAYFVMDYVKGISLQEHVAARGGRLPWAEAARLLLPVMDALEAVHSKGIVHRDVTPDNIVIDEDGNAKLLDFGAARYSMGDKSRSLDVVLKHGYAPKEQYTRHGRQGAFTDVYSLAATFYFVITGRVPPDSIDRVDRDDLILPSSLGADIPERAEDALVMALSVRVEERFQNMRGFKIALTGSGEDAITDERPEEKERKEREEREAEEARRKKIKPNKTARRIGLAATAAVLLGALLFAAGGNMPLIRYRNACKALEAQEFDEAYEAFVALGDYRDSAEKATEALYRTGVYLMDNGLYLESADIFASISGYEDSAGRVKEANYSYALELLENGKYEKAITVFQALSGYLDSEDRANEAGYLYAAEFFDAGEYEKAAAAFELVKDYKDGSERLSEAKYQYALALMSKSDWKAALSLFEELGDYQDSASYYNEAYYQYGLHLLSSRSYEDAVSVFDWLGGYQDSGDRLNEAKYGYVSAHKSNGDATTYSYLKQLKAASYKDSADIYASLYAWKITGVVNDSETDEATYLASVSKYSTIYCHIKLSGGPPDEGITLKATSIWPDGGSNTYVFDDVWYAGSSGSYYCWYETPAYGATGTLQIRISDNGTGELLGEYTVTITN